MRIAIVGCGTAGPAAALLLARDGHAVEIFERVARPRAVGAGILMQPLGQRVLDELGLAADLERESAPVRRVDARTRAGRVVMDFAYDDVLPGAKGWGVHRGTLFRLLWDAVAEQGIPVHAGVEVTGLRPARGGWELVTARADAVGPYDLVVGADGARSRIRRLSGLAHKDVGHPYGALWSVVPDPGHLATDVLWQRYDDTRTTLGILPTGTDQVSIYWSIRTRDIGGALAAGAARWRAAARPYAGSLATLVDRVGDGMLLGARYRDVVMRSPVLVRDRMGLVLLGDAAHAMSPQLGLGAGLALADAWTLAVCVRRRRGDLAAALRDHEAARRAHVRYYTWCSRLMTPVFQSDLIPVAWIRDLVSAPVARIPWVRRQFVTTLAGERTSPWTEWRWPAMGSGGLQVGQAAVMVDVRAGNGAASASSSRIRST